MRAAIPSQLRKRKLCMRTRALPWASVERCLPPPADDRMR